MIESAPATESWPGLTVAVINYNGRDLLHDTLEALRQVDYPDLRVMLVDDQSTDDSVAWVRAHFPEVRVVVVPQSRRKVSVPRNLALRTAETPYLLLLDNDVAMAPDSLKRLMRVMIDCPDTFRVVPRLVYHDKPDVIYMDVGGLSYLGISARSYRGLRVSDLPDAGPVPSIGCGIVLLHRDAALRLGGWDEGYLFGWGEDAELTIRARMLGFAAYTVRNAIGRHVEKEHGKSRAEAQFYNRHRLMLINFSTQGLLLTAPAIILFEFMMFAMNVAMGLGGRHLRALGRIVSDLPDILRHRRFIQRRRAIGDASLFEGAPILLTGIVSRSWLARAIAGFASGFFVGYWKLIRHFLDDAPYRGRPRAHAAIADLPPRLAADAATPQHRDQGQPLLAPGKIA